ncbi:MAG: hypothetical protein KF693_15355 [Nitrospira sp.]|nr:hypothetical protein [Nitrospira sp.]
MPSVVIIPRSFRPKMCYHLVHRLLKEIWILAIHRAQVLFKMMNSKRPVVVPPHMGEEFLVGYDASG